MDNPYGKLEYSRLSSGGNQKFLQKEKKKWKKIFFLMQ